MPIYTINGVTFTNEEYAEFGEVLGALSSLKDFYIEEINYRSEDMKRNELGKQKFNKSIAEGVFKEEGLVDKINNYFDNIQENLKQIERKYSEWIQEIESCMQPEILYSTKGLSSILYLLKQHSESSSAETERMSILYCELEEMLDSYLDKISEKHDALKLALNIFLAMTKGPTKSDVPKIESLNQLQDERARAIAKQYKLDVREILPTYLEVAKELEDKEKIVIDADDPNMPLNIHEIYKRKLACLAVLSYEFTKRDALTLPIDEQPAIANLDNRALSMNVKHNGTFYRIASLDVYEKYGQLCELNIDLLNKHQKVTMDRLIGE